MAAAAIALAACTPAEPTALVANRQPVATPATALVSATPAPMAAYAKTELGELIGSAPNSSAPKSVVAGERLNVELLRRFYARHGFEPVWMTRQAQAKSLMAAVL